MSRAIRPLLRELHIRWLEWAQAEICPSHPDTRHITLTLARLRAERKA
jgi:hypothetical protein